MGEVRPFLDGPGSPGMGGPEYRALLERLYIRARGGSRFELTAIAEAFARLGHPERSFPAIHVVGSNGKGSTAAFAASILASAGLKVGLYTSPHLVSFTERMQILGPGGHRVISERELLDVFARLEVVAPGFGELTFFEAVTAAAMLHFADQKIDVAVVEAGLGARLDATRLVKTEVAVLTDLSLEHTALLGDTIEKITFEKAAAICPGKPAVAAGGPPGALAVIERAALEAGAPLLLLGRDLQAEIQPDATVDLALGSRRIRGLALSLLGPHQARNAALAVQAALLFCPNLDEGAIRRGLATTVWPGRLEVVRPKSGAPIVLDGAHNRQGAEVLAQALLARPDLFWGPRHFVFGAMADKDVRGMLEVLGPVGASWIFTRPSSPRALDPSRAAELGPLGATVIEDPRSAVLEARRRAHDGGWVVVCGSLYLVGDVYADVRILQPF